MASNALITVGKFDAAGRQLETAVRLYFADGDPVSIHALTLAAYRLLSDINRKKGGSQMLKDSVAAHFPPEIRPHIRRLQNEAENFFKHADRDHACELDFDPTRTEIFLFDACEKYHELTGQKAPVLFVFQIWFCVSRYPWLKAIFPEKDEVMQLLHSFRDSTRASFFARMLLLFSTPTEG